MLEVMVALSTEKQFIPVLMYHSISYYSSPQFKSSVVSPEMFDEHLSYLERHSYTPVTVTQFVQAMSRGGERLPSRPIILTFDDGYADFYTQAFPALQRRGFTATLYVVTAFVGSTSRWLHNMGEGMRPMLTWGQLAELSASGIECGAHSHTHPPLDRVSPDVARAEIARSGEMLEQHIGQQVLSFAYPYGYYNSSVRQIVQTAGYTSACATRRGLSSLHDDPYALARLAIWPDTSMLAFATALSSGRGPLVASHLKRVRMQVRRAVRSLNGKLWPGWSAVSAEGVVVEKEMKPK
jgi:peptidoglycan/xylan/chitin deacetylase (PgdA/CDA1 family)